MVDPLDAECLLASMGVENVLRGKPTLHKYQLQQAAGMPSDIKRRMLRFLATDEYAEAEDLPPFDYQETLKLVTGEATADHKRALLATVPDPELATDLDNHAEAIRMWGDKNIPRSPAPSVTGLRIEDPPPAALDDFRRSWQVATDPMTVVRDLAEGCLSEDQVATVAMVWPALYAEMRQALTDAILATKARQGKNWEPSAHKTQQIHVFMQQPAADLELAQAVQAVYAQSAQPGPGAPKPARGKLPDATAALTPGQKAAGGAGNAG